MNDPLTQATAEQLIDVHGRDAVTVAQNAIGRFTRRNDADGQKIWQDVLVEVRARLGDIEPEGDRRRA